MIDTETLGGSTGRNQKRKLPELEAAVAAQSAITCSVIHIPKDKTVPVLSQEQNETVQLELDAPGIYCDETQRQ